MFVTEPEGALGQKSHARIRITNMQGSCVVLNVPLDYVVDKLKMEVANYLGKETSTDTDPVKISLYHKLVLAETGKVLNEDCSLMDEGVHDEDELIFIKKRVPVGTPDHHKQEEEKKNKPTADLISSLTADIPEVNKHRPAIAPLSSDHFQRELRKILITLIDAAHKILCRNPDIDKIFQTSATEEPRPSVPVLVIPSTSTPSDSGSSSVAPPPAPPPPEDAIAQLLAMGFPRQRAVKALMLNHNSPVSAIQWLVEHEEDPTLDDPVPVTPAKAPEESTSKTRDIEEVTVPKLSEIRGENRAKQVVQAFRAYKRKEFKPNPKSIKMLTEMGFGEDEVITALRHHGNSQQEALEWLLSGKSEVNEEEEDFETGLDPNSYVYKAIMSNPVVQLTLTNTKSLIAFSHMLDNPLNTERWLSDPDTGAILIQISRIYHAERCSGAAPSSTIPAATTTTTTPAPSAPSSSAGSSGGTGGASSGGVASGGSSSWDTQTLQAAAMAEEEIIDEMSEGVGEV